ncbi:MAG: hypothetical protein JXB36_18705 [Gammaproteobacteria bacterium]|nr:hypothetical protein [Gammaproteobacteria bacterium]
MKRIVPLSALAAAICAATAHAQIDDSIRGVPSEENHFIGTPEGWEHPMKPWGEPDIEAMLDMMQASRVPLERCASSYRPGAPPCDMDKAWLTEEEYNARMEEYENRVDRSKQLFEEGDVGGAIQAGLTDPNIPQRQTNLIVDPQDGLLPELTPEGKRRALTMKSDWALPGEDLTFDRPEDFDSWDRCITRGMPSSMMPYRYNGGFRIIQSPGYVIFQLEMIHEARVIPTDGSDPLPSQIEQWMGESRGHWEGNTLVVETTNYKEGPPMINLAVVGSPPGNRFPISDQMKTTERITRLNDEWWLYEITTEDPVILTEPFTVRYPMRNDPDYLMPEYACHEANTIVRNYTETSRYERANPPEEPPQPPVEVSEEVAETLDGRWVGRPRIVTIDVDIELEFTDNGDGTVNARLIGTNLGEIDKPLRDFAIDGRMISFTLPNIDPWRFQGEITEDGTIQGIVASAQGGLPVTFRPVSSN